MDFEERFDPKRDAKGERTNVNGFQKKETERKEGFFPVSLVTLIGIFNMRINLNKKKSQLYILLDMPQL